MFIIFGSWNPGDKELSYMANALAADDPAVTAFNYFSRNMPPSVTKGLTLPEIWYNY